MDKKHYMVRCVAGDFKASSLAQVKKLIQGSDDWNVSCFTGSADEGTLKCKGSAWREYYDILKRDKWKFVDKNLSVDRLCFAIYKSRIAK